MTTPEAASEAVQRRISSQTARGHVTALAVTFTAGALTSSDWLSVAVVVPSIVCASAVLLTGWRRSPARLLLVIAVAVTAPTLIWAAFTQSTPLGPMGFAITAGVWIVHRGRHQRLCAVLAVLIIAAAAFAPAVLGPDDADSPVTAFLMTVFGAVWVLVIVEGHREHQLFHRLEQAKDTERELAILRERHRFAADLHDIQGHSLHVIKLKAAVATKLQHSDPERTREELQAIARLTTETIEQGRNLAYSTHRLALTTELANAVELLEAAGISTDVRHSPTGLLVYETEFALVLREGTTNILRHARATQVCIDITPKKLTIRNDGTDPDGIRSFRGLAALRRRIDEARGDLDIHHDGGTFCLSARWDQETP